VVVRIKIKMPWVKIKAWVKNFSPDSAVFRVIFYESQERPMECHKAQDHLSAYLDGEVPEELRLEMEAHLKACAACQMELALLDRLERAFETLSAPAPPDVAQRVISQVRRPALPWWRSLSLAASLILGLALGGALAGNFYPNSIYQANGNGSEVLALEDVFRDFPQGSWGGAVVYQDEEESSA
jgi:anti-sigma factor RsiW